jgi:hypothetical protein
MSSISTIRGPALSRGAAGQPLSDASSLADLWPDYGSNHAGSRTLLVPVARVSRRVAEGVPESAVTSTKVPQQTRHGKSRHETAFSVYFRQLSENGLGYSVTPS